MDQEQVPATLEQFAPAVVQGDQLDRNERIRLEALAQAVAQSMGRSLSAESIIHVAGQFELWIRNGKGDSERSVS